MGQKAPLENRAFPCSQKLRSKTELFPFPMHRPIMSIVSSRSVSAACANYLKLTERAAELHVPASLSSRVNEIQNLERTRRQIASSKHRCISLNNTRTSTSMQPRTDRLLCPHRSGLYHWAQLFTTEQMSSRDSLPNELPRAQLGRTSKSACSFLRISVAACSANSASRERSRSAQPAASLGHSKKRARPLESRKNV